MNAPHGAADTHYDTWKTQNHNDDDAHTQMMEAARALNTEAALDGMTVTQIRARVLGISKQITELVSLSSSWCSHHHANI